MCRLTRTTRRDGQKTVEVQYAITSLTPSEAGAAELLELWRHHWDVENRLHRVWDTAWGEGRSRIRTPHPARLFAAFRGAAINLLRLQGVENITAALRASACRVDVLLSRLRGVKKGLALGPGAVCLLLLMVASLPGGLVLSNGLLSQPPSTYCKEATFG